MAQLRHAAGGIHERGAELFVIGNGAPHFARAFAKQLALTTPLWVDEERASYRALEMKRGVLPLLAPRVAAHALRAFRAGFRQTAVRGDAWQLGGVLVVRPDGRVAYRYLGDVPGDHPPVEEVLAALPPGRPAS